MPENIEGLGELDGHQFEDLIEKLIQKMGFLTEERKSSADGGVDILAVNNQPLLEGDYVIQCKRYSKPVDVSIIRDLYGVVHARNANKGILITNSRFTKPAITFAADKQLELIDGDKLMQLLSQYELLKPSENIFFNFPEGARIVQSSLITPFNKLRKQMDDYKRGLIFVNKREVSDLKWFDYVFEEKDRLVECKEIMINNLNQMFPHIYSNDVEDLNELKRHSLYILNANDVFFKNYVRLFSLEPSETWLNAHKLWLKVYEGYFEDWNNFFESFQLNMENPPEDRKRIFTLDFKLTTDAVNEWVTEYGAVQERINPQLQPKKSGCFIVTATFGSPLMKEVDIFRRYRDQTLVKTLIGTNLVNTYYRYSPFYARLIEQSAFAKSLIRTVILEPLLKILNSRTFR